MDAYFHKGMELAELGKHDKALTIFDKLLQIHEGNVNVIYAMARSNAAIANIGRALYLLELAVKKDHKTIKKCNSENVIPRSGILSTSQTRLYNNRYGPTWLKT